MRNLDETLNETKMAEPLKFTFDTAFGTRSEDVRLREPVAIITQDDVDAARTQGFVQGRIDGLAEAETQYKGEFNTTFSHIASQLETLLNAQAQAQSQTLEKAQNFALLMAKKIGQSALEQFPTNEVTRLVTDCLSHINNMPHLVVRVNPEVSQLTQDELQPLIDQKGFEGKLIVMGEENISLGDCSVEWADGGVAHSTQNLIGEINQLLNQFFGEGTDQDYQPQLDAIEDTPLELNEEISENNDEELKAEIMPSEMIFDELMPNTTDAEVQLATQEQMPQDIETSQNTESNSSLDLEG